MERIFCSVKVWRGRRGHRGESDSPQWGKATDPDICRNRETVSTDVGNAGTEFKCELNNESAPPDYWSGMCWRRHFGLYRDISHSIRESKVAASDCRSHTALPASAECEIHPNL
jgi:hypothetical protein